MDTDEYGKRNIIFEYSEIFITVTLSVSIKDPIILYILINLISHIYKSLILNLYKL